MVPRADLVVEFTGSTSVCAAYQRIPVLHATPAVLLAQFAKEIGEEVIETIATGAGVPVRDFSASAFLELVYTLLDKKSLLAQKVYAAQMQAYPTPESKDSAISAIAYVIGQELGYV
jgi:hypothetical protein